jgi:hypothetical protein
MNSFLSGGICLFALTLGTRPGYDPYRTAVFEVPCQFHAGGHSSLLEFESKLRQARTP